jgi:hypothetical protein
VWRDDQRHGVGEVVVVVVVVSEIRSGKKK